MRKMMIAAVLAAAATPAAAQVSVSQGLVNVSITDVNVLNNSLNQNEIEILNNANVTVPIQLQVPIGIAANVCPDVTAAVLAQKIRDTGSASCTATNASRALGQQVLRQRVRQNNQ